MQRHLTLSLVLPLLVASLAAAQPEPKDGAVGLSGALQGQTGTTVATFGRVSRALEPLVADGSLSASDVERAVAAAGNKVSPSEMAELAVALDGKLAGKSVTFDVSPEARARALSLILQANLSDEGRAALAARKRFSGRELPARVQEVVARAKLNGAEAYDVTATDEEDEGVYTHYPSITPATENMAFTWTEITPASLAADIADVTTQLRVKGTRILANGAQVADYVPARGGSGSVSAAYDEAYHPVVGKSQLAWRALLTSAGYEPWLAQDWTVDDVRKARSSSGDRWASNCAILADGTFHCLPAVRRHSSTPNLILTNPALARGRRLLWHGHIRIQRGKVVYVGTAGRISKRAAEGKDVYIDPIPLLEAWGFELAPGLVASSEHASARYQSDPARAIIHAAAP
ncbi:MAG: hypothetical protein AB7N76_11820 [Planctomycetota bacterium]